MLKIAKLFMNGRSQAVRLPKEYRFSGDEVFVQRQGNKVILTPTEPGWDDFFEAETVFGEDFLSDREDLPPQGRNDF